MQAYTEEQRKALAGLCKIEIKRWKAASESNPNMRYMVELMEIALASLTTPPVPALRLPDEAQKPPFRSLQIGWLNKCKCGNKKATVTTRKGDARRLWEDDDVVCNACGRKGIIQCVEGYAAVLWETDDEHAESERLNAAAPQPVPDGWKLVPVEITQEMVDANFEGVCKGGIQAGYRAMLAAAPEVGK
ncbi:hypothetical protein [Pantoea piersonii]|uniref:hypothetical protein n=1 Tax=Pantoea piersonii TaxID=2364647 RepID=UPI0028AF5A5A|nr:hypothetical protein [Pantoea piersonii]